MAEQTRELPAANHGMNTFFGVIGQGRTYKNIAYLLLSFPLGILYFVAIVTGLSTGVGLLITVLGIFVLIGTALMVHGFSAMERYLATSMVGVEVTAPVRRERPEGFWNYVKHVGGDPALWKGMAYQVLRFPLGVLAFVVVVTLYSVAISFIGAPIAALWLDLPVNVIGRETLMADAPTAAAMLVLLGTTLLFVSMHVTNGMALAYAHMARVMLGGRGETEAAPSELVRDPLGQPASQREEEIEAVPQV